MPAAKQFLRTIDEQNINVAQWADHAWSAEWRNRASRHRTFIPDARPRPLGLVLPRPAWERLDYLRTSVGCFRSSMHKWGMAPSVICECGVEDLTADHFIQRCQYLPQNGVHGLQVLDDYTNKWLLISCPNI